MWQRSEECACLGWLEDKSWPRDMEELPLGVSLAKAVADNGGESVLRKRLVAWNNADIWWERGARETVEGWRVKKKKKRGMNVPPSLFFSRDASLFLCHPRSANHPLREKSVNETNETIRRARQDRGGGGWRGGSEAGTRMMFPFGPEMAFEDFSLIPRCLLGGGGV